MITIYGQDDCVFCQKAEALCNDEGYIHRSVDIDSDILDKIEYLMGFKPKTVPQIFVNEQYVGGYTQLKEWHDNRTQGNAMIDEGAPINDIIDEGAPSYSQRMQEDLEPLNPAPPVTKDDADRGSW